MNQLDNRHSNNQGQTSGSQSQNPLNAEGIQPYQIDDLSGYINDLKNGLPRHAPPAFDKGLHEDLRSELLDNLPKRSLFIVVGGGGVDLGGTFRQDSNMHYLTGFDHRDAVALISNIPDKSQFAMVVQPRDEVLELWDGERPGPEGAIQDYGAEAAYETDDLEGAVKAALKGARNVFVVKAGRDDSLNQANTPMLRKVNRAIEKARPKLPVRDGTPYLHGMRLVKAPEEIAILKRAAEITARGHLAAMKYAADNFHNQTQRGEPFNEGQLQAVVEREFRDAGAARPSFATIVGAGEKGCTLHYNDNVTDIKDGQLVLVDAGADYGYYAGDVTRTWPISGKFTREQKLLHDLVCKAQEKAIEVIEPGTTMEEVHTVAERVIRNGLIDLGILSKDSDPDDVTKFFPHGTSHFLGMDVHDVGGKNRQAGKQLPLESGNLITVEPGIYISEQLGRENGVDPKWYGIGIRIEDDILVTDRGHENLTAMLPKSAEEIELLMNGGWLPS